MQADRGRFAEQDLFERGHKIGTAEHGDLRAGAPLLHLYGHAIDIPRTRLQQQVTYVGNHLRIGVVDHRLDHRDRLDGGRASGASCGFTNEHTQKIGLAGRIAPSGSVTGGFDTHRRQRFVVHIKHAQHSGAGGGYALHGRACRIDRGVPE